MNEEEKREKNEATLLKAVNTIKDENLKKAILEEYEDCGDILESCERIMMFEASMKKLKRLTEQEEQSEMHNRNL